MRARQHSSESIQPIHPGVSAKRIAPPPLPVSALTAAPPPVPAPPTSSFRPFLIKIAAVVFLAMGSIACGAFLLPALHSHDSQRASEDTVGSEAASPVAPAKPVAAPVAYPYPIPAAEQPTQPSPPVSAPSPFDVPKVAPRLPSQKNGYELSLQIDREIGRALKEAGIPASPISSDGEFIRRVTLDLTGKVPTRERVVAFLLDTDPTKRAKLVEDLLNDPDFGLYFARIWADILVKRDFDANRGLQTGPFVTWLAQRFNTNTRWDEIVTSLITASGPEDKTPETFFIMTNQDNRQPSPSKLVGAVGNLFMGIQIQCAECHQHPFTSRWSQNDFWGMAAFFGHTKANREQIGKGKKGQGPATITEVEQTAGGKNKKPGKNNGPAVLAGLRINIPDPGDPRKTIRVAQGKYFETTQRPPASTKAPYRPHLATWLTSPQNPFFARASANRIWAHFFARGLATAVEDINDQNKPTHPRLLRDLSESFALTNYNIKRLMRAICNSETYQRTSRPLSANKDDERLYSHMTVKVLTAQQLIDSLARVTTVQAPRPKNAPMGKKGARMGGDPLVRSFDTREYDDDPTEFSYGIPQMLRMMNSNLTENSGPMVRQLVSKHKGDHASAIQDLYLAVLSRRPTEPELARLVAHVKKQKDPSIGYGNVMWALLNSAEFISNH